MVREIDVFGREINDCKLKKNPRARKDKVAVQAAAFANCDFPPL